MRPSLGGEEQTRKGKRGRIGRNTNCGGEELLMPGHAVIKAKLSLNLNVFLRLPSDYYEPPGVVKISEPKLSLLLPANPKAASPDFLSAIAALLTGLEYEAEGKRWRQFP